MTNKTISCPAVVSLRYEFVADCIRNFCWKVATYCFGQKLSLISIKTPFAWQMLPGVLQKVLILKFVFDRDS